jgi:hypothetical protein
MEAKNAAGTYFYIHSLHIDAAGCLKLQTPQRVDLPGVQAGEVPVVEAKPTMVPPAARRK